MPKLGIGKLTQLPEYFRDSLSRTKVEYRRLGALCGLRVSNPILGGAHIGSSRWMPWVLDEAKALPLLKAAYDRGINTWDTANVYSNGESERVMGKALKKYNIPRHKVVLMTKCYRVVCDSEHYDPGSTILMQHETADKSKDYVNQWGLSRAALFSSVEASLERLQTDYIDIFYIHRFDPTVPPEETMCALNDLVRSGTVRYIGASSMWAFQFAQLQHIAEKNGWTKFVSMQNHYNLTYREEEREMIQYCNSTGVGILPWAPLASGKLARSPATNASSVRVATSAKGSFYEEDEGNTAEIVKRVEEIALQKNWPMSHVSLAWLNRRVTAPVIGFSSVERIDDILGATGKQLTPDEEQYLEEAYAPRAIMGHS